MLDQAKWQRSIDAAHAKRDEIALRFKYNRSESEHVLGLAHERGDIVHDRETGQSGVILGGTRRRLAEVQATGSE